jgi:hypothetical protein
MEIATRTYGGHLTRDGSSVIDACCHDQRIDDQLRRILGAVPQPRAPHAPVVQLPVAPERTTEAVAA